jgi:hypothetical protein
MPHISKLSCNYRLPAITAKDSKFIFDLIYHEINLVSLVFIGRKNYDLIPFYAVARKRVTRVDK